MATKTLIILRHGQAKNASISEQDHERSLTEQGKREASGAGGVLADSNLVPDYVLCSTASRTRETLAELQNSFSEPLPVVYSQKIYNASEVSLLNQLAAVPENIAKILLIGHNPGLYQLALALSRSGDENMQNELHMQFPTCALVVINFDGKWQDIINSDGELVMFTTPQKQILA